jgi:hypothetical protein
MTKNGRFEFTTIYKCDSLSNLCCRCCSVVSDRHTEFVIIKKLNSEYLIGFACEECYNVKSPEPLYDLGLSGFRVFLINRFGQINEDECIIKIEDSNLEVVKFDTSDLYAVDDEFDG